MRFAVGTEGGRLHYTVLGDAVNVAARLEKLNKVYGTDTLVAGTTVGILHGRFPLHSLGEIHLRGKVAPVTVFRLSSDDLPRAAA